MIRVQIGAQKYAASNCCKQRSNNVAHRLKSVALGMKDGSIVIKGLRERKKTPLP